MIAVAPKYQKQGLGTELFLRVVEDVLKNGKDDLTIIDAGGEEREFFIKFGAKLVNSVLMSEFVRPGIAKQDLVNETYIARNLSEVYKNHRGEELKK